MNSFSVYLFGSFTIITIILLFLNFFPGISTSEYLCPPDSFLKNEHTGGYYCHCFNAEELICSGLDSNFSNKLNLSEAYHVRTLHVSDSPHLPLLSEKFGPSNRLLTFDSLIVVQQSPPLDIHSYTQNLEALFPLLSQSLEIISSTNKTVLDIDLTSLPPTLEALYLTGVNYLRNFNPDHLPNLKSVSIDALHLQTSSGDVQQGLHFRGQSSLNRFQLTNTDLKGAVTFSPPKNCTQNNPDFRLHIDLSNNRQLTNFSFDELLQNYDPDGGNSQCAFYINFSGSKLHSNFLLDNLPLWKKLPMGTLYMIFSNIGSPLNCDTCLYNWYYKNSTVSNADYVHSIKCSSLKNGSINSQWLDQMDFGNLKLNNDCKTPLSNKK